MAAAPRALRRACAKPGVPPRRHLAATLAPTRNRMKPWPPDGSIPVSGGWNRLVIEVANLSAVMAALRPTGARFLGEPVQGPGGRQVLVDDPSGNPVELFEAALT
jgi:hypothetical protein